MTKSMDSSLRLNAVWALRNMVFLADKKCKEKVFMELTAFSVASLICGNDLHCQFLLFLINWRVPKNFSLILYTLQIRSLLFKNKLWPLFAIWLMDVLIVLNMLLLKMVSYWVLLEGNCKNLQKLKLGYRLEIAFETFIG